MQWCFMAFFFQAEDGIRDRTVTGVQTCALPIYAVPEHARDGGQAVEDVAEVEDLEHPRLRARDVVGRRIRLARQPRGDLTVLRGVCQGHPERRGIDLARDVLRDRRVALEELLRPRARLVLVLV